MIRSTVAEPNPWTGCWAEQMASAEPDECDMCGDDTWEGVEYLGGVLCPECHHVEVARVEEEG